uniref:Uncharacterized protein n=1 Tax=Aegilops tauschii subsp. strangulata TaxID=200361 RepID=A0A453KDQ4_AEGTS
LAREKLGRHTAWTPIYLFIHPWNICNTKETKDRAETWRPRSPRPQPPPARAPATEPAAVLRESCSSRTRGRRATPTRCS